MKTQIESVLMTIVVVAIVYFAIAAMAWQINNPKANQMTVYSHFVDVVCFRTLPQFQE